MPTFFSLHILLNIYPNKSTFDVIKLPHTLFLFQFTIYHFFNSPVHKQKGHKNPIDEMT